MASQSTLPPRTFGLRSNQTLNLGELIDILTFQSKAHTSLTDIRRHADWMCVLVNFGCLIFAILQGFYLGVVSEAFTWGVPIFLTSLAVTRAGAGNTWTMHLNGWLLVAMAALHVQLGKGMVEYHFSFYMLLPMMLMYRDPKPLLTMGLVILLHHLLFDMLQRSGFQAYVFSGDFSGFHAIALHAFYIAVFVIILSFLAHTLRQHATTAQEATELLSHLDKETGVNFKIRAVADEEGKVSRFGKVFNDYADNMSFIVSAFRMLRADIRELTDIASELGADNTFQLTQNAKASNNLRDFVHKLGSQTKQAQSSAELSKKITDDCFDLINELNLSSDLLSKITQQSFQAHQHIQQLLPELAGDSVLQSKLLTISAGLDHLAERTQSFMSKMDSFKGGLNAIENQAVSMDRSTNQWIEEGHSNQRRGWEVLGAMETMQSRTENAFNALNNTVETIMRSGDVVREMERRLSRFDV